MAIVRSVARVIRNHWRGELVRSALALSGATRLSEAIPADSAAILAKVAKLV
jgi:hypothetical protein